MASPRSIVLNFTVGKKIFEFLVVTPLWKNVWAALLTPPRKMEVIA
jgi:hypothetical protein